MVGRGRDGAKASARQTAFTVTVATIDSMSCILGRFSYVGDGATLSGLRALRKDSNLTKRMSRRKATGFQQRFSFLVS